MIVFNNVLDRLADNGWSANRLVKEKQLGNGSIDRLRHGLSVSTNTIDKICELCQCQPGDLMSWEPNKKE